MPTKLVCESFDECLLDLTALCEYKRQLERIENEIRTIQSKKGTLETPTAQRKRSMAQMTPATREVKKRKC